MRYKVYIYFLDGSHIEEGVKTFKQAITYKEMIDDSVSQAYIFDTVTMNVVESWV